MLYIGISAVGCSDWNPWMYTGGNKDVSFNLFEMFLFMDVYGLNPCFNSCSILLTVSAVLHVLL